MLFILLISIGRISSRQSFVVQETLMSDSRPAEGRDSLLVIDSSRLISVFVLGAASAARAWMMSVTFVLVNMVESVID